MSTWEEHSSYTKDKFSILKMLLDIFLKSCESLFSKQKNFFSVVMFSLASTLEASKLIGNLGGRDTIVKVPLASLQKKNVHAASYSV